MTTHRVIVEDTTEDARFARWQSQPLEGHSAVYTLLGPAAAEREADEDLQRLEHQIDDLEPLIGPTRVTALQLALAEIDAGRWVAVASAVIGALTRAQDGTASVILVDRDPADIPAKGRSTRRRLSPRVQVAVWRITAGYLLIALVMLLVGVLASRWRSGGGR